MFDNDTYSYKGWLTSDYLLKRALGVFVYNLLAGLIIWAVIFVIIMIFVLIAVMAAAIIV